MRGCMWMLCGPEQTEESKKQACTGWPNTREQICGTPVPRGLSSPSSKQVLPWAARAPQGAVLAMPSAGYPSTAFFPCSTHTTPWKKTFPHLRSRQADSPFPSPQYHHDKLQDSLCLFYTQKRVHGAKRAQRTDCRRQSCKCITSRGLIRQGSG